MAKWRRNRRNLEEWLILGICVNGKWRRVISRKSEEYRLDSYRVDRLVKKDL